MLNQSGHMSGKPGELGKKVCAIYKSNSHICTTRKYTCHVYAACILSCHRYMNSTKCWICNIYFLYSHVWHTCKIYYLHKTHACYIQLFSCRTQPSAVYDQLYIFYSQSIIIKLNLRKTRASDNQSILDYWIYNGVSSQCISI